MMLAELVESLPDGQIERVCIGLRWTAVVSSGEDGRRCGLATTRRIDPGHGRELLPQAGRLQAVGAKELARGILEHPHPLMHSVAVATINSLLPAPKEVERTANAEALLASIGTGHHVTIVGHFPFTERLRGKVRHLDVLEKDPHGDDLPAEAARDILPESDVIAITALTLLNGTFEELHSMVPRHAVVMMLGPSTPLSPILFKYGMDYLAGSVVENIDAVMEGVAQAASYQQLHKLGIQKVMLKAQHSESSKES
jgi:uncharacterized protein (DUF4213/DUF364 family)